jgi:lysozyme family protein
MAASSYDSALRGLLAHEGGYTNHPSDPGGPTNWGITLADARKYWKISAIAADVKAMPVGVAKAIYRDKYWNALRCDDLPAGVDYAVFDYGVNSGIVRSAKVLRRVVGANGGAGAIDDETLALVRARDATKLIAAICEERLAFLRRLKTWPVFGAGWSRRVGDVRAAALAMTAGVRGPANTSIAGGKAIVPINKAAQKGMTGGIVAAGAATAQQAHEAGTHPTLVAAIILIAVAMALGAWVFWRWRQKRQQTAPMAISAAAPRSDPAPSR